MHLRRRLRHAIDNHGVRGTLSRLLRRLAGRSTESPNAPFDDEQTHPFDVAHGVDTSGYIPGERLATGCASDFYNTAYYAVSPSTLNQALALLPEPPDRFTFVDLGCGKGRGLLVAARFAFRSILGVELAPELCRIAEKNTASDPRIAILNEDAATVAFPEEPLVIYLYHPFLAPVLRRVLRNLERQVRAAPRDVFLLYANLTYPQALSEFPFLRRVWEFRLTLSAEDAAADRHGITEERYTLFHASAAGPVEGPAA